MPPCPICGKEVKAGEEKFFPDRGTSNRRYYCTALDVEEDVFSQIETRRYMCFDHFDEHMFEIKKGKRVLLDNAVPRKLTDEEKYCLLSGDFTAARFRRLPQPDVGSEEIGDYQTKKRPKYLLVQTDCIEELLKKCQHCGYDHPRAKPILSINGTACTFRLQCSKCDRFFYWASQKRIIGRNMFEGNVEVASAAALSPIPLASLLQFAFILDLAMFSKPTWYRIMPKFWKVVQKAKLTMQDRIFDFLYKKTNGLIQVTDDAQFDTRGFSAYMCCYTLMDAATKFVLTNICLDKREEKCASTQLEVIGLQKALAEIARKGLEIVSLTTDRSKSIIIYVRANHPSITHMYDAWHVIKSVASVLRLECKKKRASKLQQWCQALLNHLWYSVVAANGNGVLCQQYVVSALLHTIGVHEWSSDTMSAVLHDKQSEVLGKDNDDVLKNDPLDLPGKTIHELVFDDHVTCSHLSDIQEDKDVLNPESPSYGIFLKNFTSDNFLNDIKHLSPALATSALEGFQGLVSNKYRSKNVYYDKKGFDDRTCLPFLHYNNNIWDELTGKRKVEKVIERRGKHRGGEIVFKNIKTPTDYSWKKEILFDTLLKFDENMPEEFEEHNESDDENDEDNERETMGELVGDMFEGISDEEN